MPEPDVSCEFNIWWRRCNVVISRQECAVLYNWFWLTHKVAQTKKKKKHKKQALLLPKARSINRSSHNPGSSVYPFITGTVAIGKDADEPIYPQMCVKFIMYTQCTHTNAKSFGYS